MNEPLAPPTSGPRPARDLRVAVALVAAAVLGVLGVAVVGGGGSGSTGAAGPDEPTEPTDAIAASDSTDTTDTTVAREAGEAAEGTDAATGDELPDLVGVSDVSDAASSGDEADVELADLTEADPDDPASLEGCVLEDSVRLGDSGFEVSCLQQALIDQGFLDGEPTGDFDQATHDAVIEVQSSRKLYVDGVAGRETALSLEVWKEEQSNVIRTPPPPPGAVDLWGYPLSSVATSGPDAPPLPEGSGSGKRLVYQREGQRVWAVDENEVVIRSWLVTGSQYENEVPGTHYVYSRSIESTAWNGAARLPKMVRWLQTERGHIGFHGIPTDINTGEPYQTDAQLGHRLSGGCQRQADLDADFVWDFAPEGTKVVVL